jgi:hypothetical protein
MRTALALELWKKAAKIAGKSKIEGKQAHDGALTGAIQAFDKKIKRYGFREEDTEATLDAFAQSPSYWMRPNSGKLARRLLP